MLMMALRIAVSLVIGYTILHNIYKYVEEDTRREEIEYLEFRLNQHKGDKVAEAYFRHQLNKIKKDGIE